MTFVESGHVKKKKRPCEERTTTDPVVVKKQKRPCEEWSTTDPVFLKKPYPIIPINNSIQ